MGFLLVHETNTKRFEWFDNKKKDRVSVHKSPEMGVKVRLLVQILEDETRSGSWVNPKDGRDREFILENGLEKK